jgi:hypothetical protein
MDVATGTRWSAEDLAQESAIGVTTTRSARHLKSIHGKGIALPKEVQPVFASDSRLTEPGGCSLLSGSPRRDLIAKNSQKARRLRDQARRS